MVGESENSADPGCGGVDAGKVPDPSKPLQVEHKICYSEQSSAPNALCAILHQLVSVNGTLLQHAVSQFLQLGGKISQNLPRPWAFLVHTAEESISGEIVCVLDALDECESGRIWT